jgi:hypothetical protein
LLVAALAFAGSFCYLGAFGFYEDDFAFVVPYLDRGAGAVWNQFISAFVHWPSGRPLNHSLPHLFAWSGFRTGHFWGVYLLCAIVIMANSLLVYRLVGKILGPFAAVTGALFFALYPADTTRPFIVHAAHLQTGLTFTLIGLLLYTRGDWKSWAAYPVAALSLLAYESTFLPFLLGVPMLILLEYGQGRRWARTGRHLLLCAAILSGFAMLRLWIGESRATEALFDPGQTLWRSVSSLWIGPTTSFKAVIIALGDWSFTLLFWEIAVIILCGLAVFVVLRACARPQSDSPGYPAANTLWIVGFGGVVMWVGSYGLSIINYPPDFLGGRFTSAHAAGAVGAAVAFAALTATVLKYSESRRSVFVISTVSIFFACLVMNGLAIQRDYVAAWEMEKQFWAGLLQATPDLRHDDVVVITGEPPPQPRSIKANSWADTLVLAQLVEFEQTGPGPLAFWIDRSFIPEEQAFRQDGDSFWIRPMEWTPDEQKQVPDMTILLNRDEKGWHRLDEITLLDGSTVLGRALNDEQPGTVKLSWFGKQLFGKSDQ